MNVIVDPRTNNVTYYDDYICDMKIQIFSDLSDTAPVYEGTIIEVFPKQIDAIQLGFDLRLDNQYDHPWLYLHYQPPSIN